MCKPGTTSGNGGIDIGSAFRDNALNFSSLKRALTGQLRLLFRAVKFEQSKLPPPFPSRAHRVCEDAPQTYYTYIKEATPFRCPLFVIIVP